MGIVFAGGTISNGRDPAAQQLVIGNGEASDLVWRDLRNGLLVEEQALFQRIDLGDGRSRLALTPAGQALWTRHRAAPAERLIHEHVAQLIRETVSTRRTVAVFPAPVFRPQPPERQWLVDIVTRQNPTRAQMAIAINGHGVFPVEFLGFEVAGRTQGLRRDRDTALAYISHVAGEPVAPRVQAAWNAPTNRRRQVNRLVGDTAGTWADREGSATLFHELIGHAIVGHAHGSSPAVERYFTWVERRANVNWRAAEARRAPAP
ncbi:MAG: hypothetical protein AAFR52_11180 [Pseudomonadota bacterium]